MTIKIYGEVLRALMRCIPDGWSLNLVSMGDWRLYDRDGIYYGSHRTPEECIQATLVYLKDER